MTSSDAESAMVPESFLALLDQAEREALHDLGVVRVFPRGSLMMLEGEPGGGE